MRPTLSLKTLLRTPFKTAITLLLIAAASFALFSRVADYAVSAREMSKVKDSYNGVIALDNGIPGTNGNKFKASNMPKTMKADDDFGNPYVPQSQINALTAEQINTFSELPGVTVDTRYMTGGVIENMERLNPLVSSEYDWGYDYGGRFIIEGTYEGNSGDLSILPFGTFCLNFSDIKQLAGRTVYEDGGVISLLAGNPSAIAFTQDDGEFFVPYIIDVLIRKGEDKTLFRFSGSIPTPWSNSYFFFADDPYRENFAKNLVPGKKYLFIGRYIPNTFDRSDYESKTKTEVDRFISDPTNVNDAITDADLIATIKEGDITVISLEEFLEKLSVSGQTDFYRVLSEYISGKPMMRLGDFDTYDYCPSFLELTDAENIAKAKELIDITNQDAHTFDMVYTTNMAAIPRFNEKSMTITEGRAITAQDNNTNICVISKYLADAYGLKLGDKLNIGLGDKLFEQYAQMGAIAYVPERRWNVTKIEELEIVGVYKDIDSQERRQSDMYMGYSPNTIFLPLSLLPVEIPAEHEIKPGEFSLFIQNADDYEKIMATAEPLAVETGIKLRASDGGYANVKDSINESKKTSVITMSLYIFAAALALTLSAYLYIVRGKKTYAIMRTLGTSVNKSRNALLLPLGVLVAVAVPLGGIIGLVYTSNEMTAVLKGFEVVGGSYVADTSVSAKAVVITLLGEVGFIAIFTMLFLRKLGKTPPLSLLQGVTVDRRKKELIDIITSDDPPTNIGAFKMRELSPQRGYSAFRHVTSYIFRHMRRVGWKTVIALTLAFVLTGAIGVITLIKYNYEEMFRQVEVKSNVYNVTYNNLIALSNSDLVRDIYLFGNYTVSADNVNNSVDLIMTNDINRYLDKSDFSIEYAEGYSDEIFSANILSDNDVCVIGGDVARNYGLTIGDYLPLVDFYSFQATKNLLQNYDYRNIIAALYEGGFETEEELQALVEREVEKDIAKATVSCKVAGIIESKDNDIVGAIYMPPGKTAEYVLTAGTDGAATRIPVNFTQTVLLNNDNVDEINAFLENIVSVSTGEYASWFADVPSYHTDTTELDNIRRVRDLLATLFPIAVTAAVLIGATAPLLIIIQSAKEAAIMRILGTTKKRIRCILAFEQILLCAVGLICAAGGLVIYNAGLFAYSAQTLIMCGVLYLFGGAAAALAAAVSVTSRKVLNLLQVKE